MREPTKTVAKFRLPSDDPQDPESTLKTGTITVEAKEVGEENIVIYEVLVERSDGVVASETIATRSELERYLRGMEAAYSACFGADFFPRVAIPG